MITMYVLSTILLLVEYCLCLLFVFVFLAWFTFLLFTLIGLIVFVSLGQQAVLRESWFQIRASPPFAYPFDTWRRLQGYEF